MLHLNSNIKSLLSFYVPKQPFLSKAKTSEKLITTVTVKLDNIKTGCLGHGEHWSCMMAWENFNENMLTSNREQDFVILWPKQLKRKFRDGFFSQDFWR